MTVKTGKLDFGKHEGKLISEVPAMYLHWMVRNLSIREGKYPFKPEWAKKAFKELWDRGATWNSFYDIGKEIKEAIHSSFGNIQANLKLEPGLVLVWQTAYQTPKEKFKPGQAIRLVAPSSKSPYTTREGNFWKVETPWGITVWTILDRLIKSKVLLPVFASKTMMSLDWTGTGNANECINENGIAPLEYPNEFPELEVPDQELAVMYDEARINADKIDLAEATAKAMTGGGKMISEEPRYFQVYHPIEMDTPEQPFAKNAKFKVKDRVVIKPLKKRGGEVGKNGSDGFITMVHADCKPIRYAVETGYFGTSGTYDEEELKLWKEKVPFIVRLRKVAKKAISFPIQATQTLTSVWTNVATIILIIGIILFFWMLAGFPLPMQSKMQDNIKTELQEQEALREYYKTIIYDVEDK